MSGERRLAWRRLRSNFTIARSSGVAFVVAAAADQELRWRGRGVGRGRVGPKPEEAIDATAGHSATCSLPGPVSPSGVGIRAPASLPTPAAADRRTRGDAGAGRW